MRLCSFEGLRAAGPARQPAAPLEAAPSPSGAARRGPLRVEALKKANKRVKVVLAKGLPNLGEAGTMTTVPLGYYRNYLLPKGLAGPATQEYLNRMVEEEAAKGRAIIELKAKAQAMATALRTIGKFVIKKKAGDNNQIFGSVTPAEIVAAIAAQTGRDLDKRMVSFPEEPKAIGTYDCNVRLHPEVTGAFKVVVQREKQS